MLFILINYSLIRDLRHCLCPRSADPVNSQLILIKHASQDANFYFTSRILLFDVLEV